MRGFGPIVSMCSIGSFAKTTRANPSQPKKEKTNDQTSNCGRLWHADRARHLKDRTSAAGSDRAGVGVSDGKRTAAPMVGCGSNADDGGGSVRGSLAQR